MTAHAKPPGRLLIVDLDAVLLPDVGDPQPSCRPRAQAVETLARLHQAGARVFLLVTTGDEGDGLALDRRLTQCDRLQQIMREAGGRLEGAVVAALEPASVTAVAEALADVARRAQARLADICVVSMTEHVPAGVAHYRLADGADFPTLAEF
jgi:hypothetical protein